MTEPARGWRTYYAGQAVLCPGVKLNAAGRAERRQQLERRHEPREPADRRELPQPHQLTRCEDVFVRVGFGNIWRIRWLGDRWNPVPPCSGTTHKCACGTVFEVEVERVARSA